MRISGKQAWAIMAISIFGYEIWCEEDQLLSVIVDEWLVTHPIATRAVIAAVSLHLANVLPWWTDPLGKKLWKAIFGSVRVTRSTSTVSP